VAEGCALVGVVILTGCGTVAGLLRSTLADGPACAARTLGSRAGLRTTETRLTCGAACGLAARAGGGAGRDDRCAAALFALAPAVRCTAFTARDFREETSEASLAGRTLAERDFALLEERGDWEADARTAP